MAQTTARALSAQNRDTDETTRVTRTMQTTQAGQRQQPGQGLLGGAALVAGITAAGMALASLGVGYYVARKLTAPQPIGPMDSFTMSPFEMGATYEEVAIPTANGHTLEGWWLTRPESDRVIIGCVGYRGSKWELLGIGSALWRAGFNVLLFDYHGHGAGRGAPVTLGYRELNDFFTAYDYARGRLPDGHIGVIGFSMGAAITIMGAAQRPGVEAVIADSPFATHADVLSHAISRTLHAPGAPFTCIADHFIYRRVGYRSADVQPIRAIGQIAPRPLLIIHGTADQTIPVSHAYQLFAAAGEPKELWIAEGAEHCGAYFLNRPYYCERAISFFDRTLGAGLGTATEDVALTAVESLSAARAQTTSPSLERAG